MGVIVRRGSRAVAILLVLAAVACSKSPPHGISDQSQTFAPRDVAWNGVKVYLSSPRHASSGSRGECGWEENINGRIFNLYAADLNDGPGESTLSERGYEVRVSPNSRDDGWRLNRDESNNWGANVHIVTHSNAFGAGCGDAAQYLLVMFKTGNANSMGLRDELLARLDPQVPGGRNSWNCDTLGECASNAAHIAYIELFFHTNQAAVDWFVGPASDPHATGAMSASPHLGLALDEHLGYPRSTGVLASPLDAYPGFGRSADAVLRDETIAYWEAFRREQFVATCMGDAGFDYTPAVAFPAQDTADVAEHLGISGEAGPSPVAQNRAYEAGLSSEERERYNQTLLGESAAAVAEADRTGIVPDGRADDFARGGCVGAAAAAIPSVWDAPRQLTAELETMRQDIARSAELQEAGRAYAECAQDASGLRATSPADLDETVLEESDGSADAARAFEECASVWASGYEEAATAVADRFVQEQSDRLAAVATRYADVMTQIAEDEALAAYLSTRVE